MSTRKENGFEGPLPSSIKPDGFHCYRRGGCDRHALCEGRGECVGVDPPVSALHHSHLDETAEIECLDGGPAAADALARNPSEEIAEILRSLTYAEMIELTGGLWRLRGEAGVNRETLPRMLYAWARQRKLTSDFRHEPVLQPIDVAPKDRPILAFMLGRWRIARWNSSHPPKRPIPFWSADDLRVTVSREHQPKWWAELPPPPPDVDT